MKKPFENPELYLKPLAQYVDIMTASDKGDHSFSGKDKDPIDFGGGDLD